MDWALFGKIGIALFLALSGPFAAIGWHRKVRGQDTPAWVITMAVSPATAALGMSLLMLWYTPLPPPHEPLLGGALYILMIFGLYGMYRSTLYYGDLFKQLRTDPPTDAQQDGPDASEPTPERQAELRAAYEDNVRADNEPYDNVRIRTLGELRWIMRERGWDGNELQDDGDDELDANGEEEEEDDKKEPVRAQLYGAVFDGANLSGVHLIQADLTEVSFNDTNLSDADLNGADLRGARFLEADLSQASPLGVRLSRALMLSANLSHADLSGSDLGRALFRGADLRGADLTDTRMSARTELIEVVLDSHTSLADVQWGDAPLTRVDWGQLPIVGDEREAHRRVDSEGKRKNAAARLEDCQTAVRAYRQLSVALRSQGLNEHADRFAYRAQLLQRRVFRHQRSYVRYLGSGLLDLIAGYGYRPLRSFLTYALVVLTFAAAYLTLGGSNGQALSWNEAIVVSMTAFHGRGFFSTAFSPGDPQAAVAAAEALIGLLIEITFIATFTQRFFAR